MNQQKIGQFLKALRKDQKLTQEQLADILGTSSRSVSRWETGKNMPDFDLLIELAKMYDVGIDEILNGERTNKDMDKKTEETYIMVAKYDNAEKDRLAKKLTVLFSAGLISFIGYAILESNGLSTTGDLYEKLANVSLGIVLGTLVVGLFHTTGLLIKIKASKDRLLKRMEEN